MNELEIIKEVIPVEAGNICIFDTEFYIPMIPTDNYYILSPGRYKFNTFIEDIEIDTFDNHFFIPEYDDEDNIINEYDRIIEIERPVKLNELEFTFTSKSGKIIISDACFCFNTYNYNRFIKDSNYFTKRIPGYKCIYKGDDGKYNLSIEYRRI